MRRPMKVLAVAAAVGLAAVLWRERPAIARYLKMERM